MSDLHLEFTKYKPDELPSVGEDLVILAGDVGTGTAGIYWAMETFPDVPILYVLGNHEYYGYDWNQLVKEARSASDGSNVVLLENDSFHYKGLRFLGASLWTNFLLGGPAAREQAMAVCQDFINDYRHIRLDGRVLNARDSIARHEESLAWLRGELASSDAPTVVITHHGPCLAAGHPGYLLDVYSNVFLSNLPDELFLKPKAWIFGHTHHSMTAPHRGTVLYSNQRGYPDEGGNFDWDKVLEIDPRTTIAGSEESR